MTINGASTTIAGKANPGPIYKYDADNHWALSYTAAPPTGYLTGSNCKYNGVGVADNFDLSLTSVTGSDGYTYLRGEYQERVTSGFSYIDYYAIARQVQNNSARY